MWPSTIGRKPTTLFSPSRRQHHQPSPTEGVTVKVQRVITRQDTHGKSVVVSDEDIDPITLKLLPGAALHPL
jgi:hypothetical protein